MRFVGYTLLVVGGFFLCVIFAAFCDTVLRGRVPCPWCRGDGKGEQRLVGYRKDWDGASPMVFRDYPVYKRDRCGVCGGSGTVPHARAATAVGDGGRPPRAALHPLLIFMILPAALVLLAAIILWRQ